MQAQVIRLLLLLLMAGTPPPPASLLGRHYLRAALLCQLGHVRPPHHHSLLIQQPTHTLLKPRTIFKVQVSNLGGAKAQPRLQQHTAAGRSPCLLISQSISQSVKQVTSAAA
jgi:hypothetical protein